MSTLRQFEVRVELMLERWVSMLRLFWLCEVVSGDLSTVLRLFVLLIGLMAAVVESLLVM